MESRLDTDNDWKKLLDDTAVEVDRLIRTNLNTFKKKVKPFAKRWKDHCSEIKRCHQRQKDHWKKVKIDPKLQDKGSGPPEETWEWDKDCLSDLPMGIGPDFEIPVKHVNKIIKSLKNRMEINWNDMQQYAESSREYQDYERGIRVAVQDLVDLQFEIKKVDPAKKKNAWIMAPSREMRDGPSKSKTKFEWWKWLNLPGSEEVFGCWRPPQKEISEDPCDQFVPPKGSDRLPVPRDESEEYERYYVVLASIHDNCLPATQSVTCDLWSKELADQVWGRLSWGQPYGPDGPFVRTAIERVKADLDTTPRSKSGRSNSGNTKGGTPGRPRVSGDHVEVERRRDLKKRWEDYQSANLKGADKEQFCKDASIKVAYLNNRVLRWCREHPE